MSSLFRKGNVITSQLNVTTDRGGGGDGEVDTGNEGVDPCGLGGGGGGGHRISPE